MWASLVNIYGRIVVHIENPRVRPTPSHRSNAHTDIITTIGNYDDWTVKRARSCNNANTTKHLSKKITTNREHHKVRLSIVVMRNWQQKKNQLTINLEFLCIFLLCDAFFVWFHLVIFWVFYTNREVYVPSSTVWHNIVRVAAPNQNPNTAAWLWVPYEIHHDCDLYSYNFYMFRIWPR